MQAVNFYTSSVFLVLTLIASTTCDSVTVASSAGTPSITPTTNDTSSIPANITAPSEAPVLNDEPKVDPVNTVVPTRLPATEAAALPSKPPINHDPSTMKSTGSMPNGTAMGSTNGTMGTKATNTDKDNKNGASRGGPEVLVTSIIVLVLRVFFA